MCKYFFSILILFIFSLTAICQDKKPRVDTVKNKYLPTGLRVGMDVITLIRSRDHSFKGWEINFDTDLSRYYFTVDYGYWATDQLLGNGNYQNAGTYLRIGTDINFLLKDPDKNMFFFGFRYGLSSFHESVQYQNPIYYSGFKAIDADESNGSVSGRWLEITSGLRVKIVSGFWMGYTARLKFAPSVSGQGKLSPYDMPGYGLVAEAPYWGFNYDLYWRFGWKK
jgi:Domain of unknown function (DUF6048)